MLKLFVEQKRSSLGYHHSVPNELFQEATRAALSEMGRRVDDLNIHQDETLEFTLTWFL